VAWGEFVDRDEIARLVPLLRAGKGIVTTKPSCLQVAMAEALREAEAELADARAEIARLNEAA
jgi:predicted dehydrogenase